MQYAEEHTVYGFGEFRELVKTAGEQEMLWVVEQEDKGSKGRAMFGKI